MDELKEMLYCELDEMTKMGDMSKGTLKTIGEILDAIKDIETIEAMSEGGYSGEYANEGGNSMRGRYYRDGYYRDGREGSYEGNSYRKRNRMGQFSRYSREGESDKLVEKIETLMDDTTNGGDREKIRSQIMEVMDKYK